MLARTVCDFALSLAASHFGAPQGRRGSCAASGRHVRTLKIIMVAVVCCEFWRRGVKAVEVSSGETCTLVESEALASPAGGNLLVGRQVEK